MRPLVLVILDGWGVAPPGPGNAISLAKTPNYDRLLRGFPNTILKASGEAVGLPRGTQGGSEPGHLTIGAGRIVHQPLELINLCIRDGSFFRNKALLLAVRNAKAGRKLHLMGLFSDEGVHATTAHLYALMGMAGREGAGDVFVHAFLDGRDTPERSALRYVRQFRAKARQMGVGKLASLVGRYYAMDRDTNWGRTKAAYDLLVHGRGFRASTPEKALTEAYARGDKTDYYVRPTALVGKDGRPVALVGEGDSVVFYNFRSDRARQLTYMLALGRHADEKPPKTRFVCMSDYDRRLRLPVAFEQLRVRNNLGQVLSRHGLRQLRTAETEKYAHITFFLNSQVERPEKGEDRILIPSPKVPSYDQKPEMSAPRVCKTVVSAIREGKHDFIAVNFANPDLVGHSGVIRAVVRCCEVLDDCMEEIVKETLKRGGVAIITGDHGNAENKLYPDGSICPAHGTNPVPFIIVSEDERIRSAKLRRGELKDIAPTVLELLGIRKPKEMTGESLILWKR